jgi:hypothetical protein
MLVSPAQPPLVLLAIYPGPQLPRLGPGWLDDETQANQQIVGDDIPGVSWLSVHDLGFC